MRATSAPASRRAPSARIKRYAQGGRTSSNTLAATSAPDRTPACFARMTASPLSSGSTIDWVVTSTPPRPRSSRSARATSSSSSGFDETIRFLPQSKCLLRETEQVRALAADAALLAGRFDHTAVDHLAPEIATIDRESEDCLVDVLELADGELLWEELKADRRVADLAAQAADRVIDDLAVVERHLDGEAADRMPLLFAVFGPSRACAGQGRRHDG